LKTGRPDETNAKERISEKVGDENADHTAPEPVCPNADERNADDRTPMDVPPAEVRATSGEAEVA
jgi:hypothetical protein